MLEIVKEVEQKERRQKGGMRKEVKKKLLFIYNNEPEEKTKYSSSELQIKIKYGHPG